MKRNCRTALFILLAITSTAAYAEDIPRANLYLGYPFLFEGSQLFGANAALDVNVNKWFGVRGDFGLHFGEVYADKSLSTFLAGPVFSIPTGRLTPFGHALFGGTYSGCGEFNLGCRSTVVFATAAGGGVNVKAGKRLGVRVLADDLRARLGGKIQHYPRLSAGIVFSL